MELTPRAAVFGVVLGALLAAGNVYMGLRTGFWETGIVTATVISAAVLPVLGRRFDPVEITLAQSIAVSVGAAPAVAGLLGAVPGLALLGLAPAGWVVVLLGLGCGGLGLVIAQGLRARLLEDEALPFPSGVAAGEVLCSRGGEGAVPLGLAGVLSAAVTALREVRLLPVGLLAPGGAGLAGVGLALSPMLLGAGALIGVASAWAIAAGAGIAWVWLAPMLVRSGAVPDASFGAVASWLLWPGVGLLLGSAVASLARDAGAFRAGAVDLTIAVRGVLRSRRLGGLTVLALALMLTAGRAGFGLGALAGALALLPVTLAAIACARVTGKTDVSPAGEMGQVVQGAAGALGLGATGSTGAGAMAAGCSSQASVALWSLRAGARVGVSPGAQVRAHLVGLITGAVIAVPLYQIFVSAHALGSTDLPAPTALRWRALAELVGGASALPPGASWALPAAIAAGVLLDLLCRTRVGRFVPSPGAMAVGFLIPPHYAVTMLAGGVLGAAARRSGRGAGVEPVAAGAIAGESLAALIAGGLDVLGWRG